METQGEQLQGAMRGLNVENPADQAEMVRLLSNIDPIRGASAAAIFAEEKQRIIDRDAQREYRRLQEENIQGQIDARRSASEASSQEEERRKNIRNAASNRLADGHPVKELLDAGLDLTPTALINIFSEPEKSYRIEEIFDSTTGSNRIVAIDINDPTAPFLDLAASPQRANQNIDPFPSGPQMSNIRAMIEGDEELTLIAEGKDTWLPFDEIDPITSEMSLVNMIYHAAERNKDKGITPLDIINRIKEQVKTPEGKQALAQGIINLGDYSVPSNGGSGEWEIVTEEEANLNNQDANSDVVPTPIEVSNPDEPNPQENFNKDNSFEIVLNNLTSANQPINEAINRYLQNKEVELENALTIKRNREATNADTTEIDNRIDQINSYISNYSAMLNNSAMAAN